MMKEEAFASTFPDNARVLCINRRHEIISSSYKISLLRSIFSGRYSLFFPLGLAFLLTFLGFQSESSLFLSSLLVIFANIILSRIYCDAKEEVDSRDPDAIPFCSMESNMANINITNCSVHVRNVKILESGDHMYRLSVTYKSHRWHVWR
jgi:hypothetical protein